MIEIPKEILNTINHNNVTLNPLLSSTHSQSRRKLAVEIKILSTRIRSLLNTTDTLEKILKKTKTKKPQFFSLFHIIY